MNEEIFAFLAVTFSVPLLLGSLFFIGYIIEEQEHKHKIELEKAKQGIFDDPHKKENFFNRYCKSLIFVLLISIIIIIICYTFKVPSDLPKYILEIIK